MVEGRLPGQVIQCPQCDRLVVYSSNQGGEVEPPLLEEPFCVGAVSAEEPDSIFASPEAPADALFGAEAAPCIEMPAEPGDSSKSDAHSSAERVEFSKPPEPVVDGSLVIQATSAPEIPFQASVGPAPAVEPHSANLELESGVPVDSAMSSLFAPAAPLAGELMGPQLDAAFPLPAAARPVRRSMRSGLFIALVLFPLISYSILATIAVVILYLRPQPPHPLENLPDVEGQFKGAKHQKQKPVTYERAQHDLDLPAKLRLSLGQSLRLGDVEVTPLRVELRRLKMHSAGFAPDLTREQSLLLHLLFRNVSRDVVFSPTDPFFDRRWKGLSVTGRPYTFLEFAGRRFYGGPVSWNEGGSTAARETIEGQHYGLLQPGEEVATFVCTDPADGVVEMLSRFRGPLVWRVQFRRGLVPVGAREISATAVCAVQFTEGQVSRSEL
jgi:hypothetical protein